MRISELMSEEMSKSDTYRVNNFGAPMGSDWPEMARELLSNERVCIVIMSRFVAAMLTKSEFRDRIDKTEGQHMSGSEMLSSLPEIYSGYLQFFYWGVQVGRNLEREQGKLLTQLEDGGRPEGAKP